MRAVTLGVVAVSVVLAGCSDIYYDRRETVASGAADAVASNIALQTIDPWPANVANTNIPMNGARAALAIQRYRTGRVLSPVGSGTSSAGYNQQPQTPQQSGAGAAQPSATGTQIQ